MMMTRGSRKERCSAKTRMISNTESGRHWPNQAVADKRITEMFLSWKHYTGIIVCFYGSENQGGLFLGRQGTKYNDNIEVCTQQYTT